MATQRAVTKIEGVGLEYTWPYNNDASEVATMPADSNNTQGIDVTSINQVAVTTNTPAGVAAVTLRMVGKLKGDSNRAWREHSQGAVVLTASQTSTIYVDTDAFQRVEMQLAFSSGTSGDTTCDLMKTQGR